MKIASFAKNVIKTEIPGRALTETVSHENQVVYAKPVKELPDQYEKGVSFVFVNRKNNLRLFCF